MRGWRPSRATGPGAGSTTARCWSTATRCAGSAPTPTCRRRPAADAEHDLHGALVTPGLIDAHTHLVYGGDRAAEFEQRLQGASYEDIARAGGGIRATVAGTRAASDEQLFADAAARARTLMAEGVTTIEIKSGYGLSQAARSALPGASRGASAASCR